MLGSRILRVTVAGLNRRTRTLRGEGGPDENGIALGSSDPQYPDQTRDMVDPKPLGWKVCQWNRGIRTLTGTDDPRKHGWLQSFGNAGTRYSWVKVGMVYEWRSEEARVKYCWLNRDVTVNVGMCAVGMLVRENPGPFFCSQSKVNGKIGD